MIAKIITSLILLIVNISAGIFFNFMLMLVLNGFSGSDADLSFIIYIIGIAALTILTIGLGVLSVHFIKVEKIYYKILSVVGVSLVFSGIAIVGNFVLLFVSAFVASLVRENRLS